MKKPKIETVTCAICGRQCRIGVTGTGDRPEIWYCDRCTGVKRRKDGSVRYPGKVGAK